MESLLFVFGKRAKRMRLNKLNELIHNSSTQNNLKFARVTIFFKEIKDIEDEKFEDIPGSEFILSREVYKNGSSKYFLNNRDIGFDALCEILNKKGIDLKHNRFLILQGEVEQISMMKPKASTSGDEGLLEFLEDIIGTNRYVSLIEKVSTDIDELSEIKTQKANRVKLTKNELDQLEDIKNASTEYYKKEKELHIFGHLDFLIKRHQINKQILECQTKIQAHNDALSAIDKKIQEKVQENSYIIEEHKKIKKEQDVLVQKKNDLTKEMDSLDELDKVKRADIENYSKNISKAKTALEKSNKNYQTQSENIQNARNDLPKKSKELAELSDMKKALEKYINEKEQDLFEKTEKIQVKKREVEKQILPYEEKINQNKFQIEQNNSTINLMGQKFEKINADVVAVREKKADCERVISEKKEAMGKGQDAIDIIEAQLKESREILGKANADLETKYKTTQNLLAKLSEIKSSNQERTQKNNILDSLLKAQQEGKLGGIYGRLGDLGVIDSKYDIAVTTACAHLDSILVENVEHSQKCLDFLKKNGIGRATFLILDKISWVESKMRENFRAPNGCERLYDLIRCKNQRLYAAFYYALRNTLVAPDLRTATSVAYGSVRHRVVTINGELIENSGTMSGGGKPRRGGMSSKEFTEDYSQDYINRLTQEYENMVKEFEIAKIERNSLETRCNKLNSQLQESLIFKNKTENEVISIQKMLTETDKNLSSLNKEFDKYQKDMSNLEELKKVNSELEQKSVELIEESKSLREELEQIEIEIKKIGGDEFNKKKEELKNIKKRMDTLEKEINTMRNLTQNAAEVLEKIKDEIEHKEKVIKDYENLIDEIKMELDNIEKKGMEFIAQIEVCHRDIANLNEKFNNKSKEVEELKVAIRKMRDEQEKLKGEISEIGAEIKKLEKNEKLINDDLNKNKKSFKKLVEEFGFIDDFEKEIKCINAGKNHQYNAGGMLVDDEENQMDVENSLDEEEQEIEAEENKRGKIRKVSNNYRKYVDPKFMEYAFKMEELDDLSKSTKEIAYEYTMLQTKINDMKPNMNAILVYKNKVKKFIK